ncbi:uncharacterized protein LOC123310672 [Coccinella septempunctata]|uniref:uncharacterized protein LOC123310672 n=1 Tax=Coccinella septempunctata TaxID=41139 RepID=UPI001D07626B|nr:uncharacterized protein LOC123310672 [Coccinella septempunctata]
MRFALIIFTSLVGSALISNVDCTHKLLGGLLLGRDGLDPLQPINHNLPIFRIFDEFFNVFRRIFGGIDDGINRFLDGCSKGLPNLLNGSFGEGRAKKLLGPLSQIPDDADLPSLVGDRFKGKTDKLSLLVQFAKKFCISGKCERLEGGDSGNPLEDIQKRLREFFDHFGHQLENGLDGFNSGLEELISSLGNGRHNEIFECLSKLPDDFDPSHILGKEGSSQSADGILSRKDILSLLTKFAKSKCSSGCDKS